MVELKNEGVQISNINFHGKSYAMIGESNWRPKTRAKNKLRLSMKRILNPTLMKEKITEIEDSSSQEDVEKGESLSPQQAHTRKHHSVMLESSTSKKKIA